MEMCFNFSIHYLGQMSVSVACEYINNRKKLLSHDQYTRHADKGCAEMHNFCMATLMFLTGHGIKAKTHGCAEIAHFPTRYMIRTW